MSVRDPITGQTIEWTSHPKCAIGVINIDKTSPQRSACRRKSPVEAPDTTALFDSKIHFASRGFGGAAVQVHRFDATTRAYVDCLNIGSIFTGTGDFWEISVAPSHSEPQIAADDDNLWMLYRDSNIQGPGGSLRLSRISTGGSAWTSYSAFLLATAAHWKSGSRPTIGGNAIQDMYFNGLKAVRMTPNQTRMLSPGYWRTATDLYCHAGVGYTDNARLWSTWKANQAYTTGEIIKVATNYFVSGSNATSGSSAPTWDAVAGHTTVDGGVTWTCLGTTTWRAAFDYALGDVVIVGSNYHYVTTAGTSGASAPTWTTTAGATTSDGTVTWTANSGITMPKATWAFAPVVTTDTIGGAIMTHVATSGQLLIGVVTPLYGGAGGNGYLNIVYSETGGTAGSWKIAAVSGQDADIASGGVGYTDASLTSRRVAAAGVAGVNEPDLADGNYCYMVRRIVYDASNEVAWVSIAKSDLQGHLNGYPDEGKTTAIYLLKIDMSNRGTGVGEGCTQTLYGPLWSADSRGGSAGMELQLTAGGLIGFVPRLFAGTNPDAGYVNFPEGGDAILVYDLSNPSTPALIDTIALPQDGCPYPYADSNPWSILHWTYYGNGQLFFAPSAVEGADGVFCTLTSNQRIQGLHQTHHASQVHAWQSEVPS